MYSLAAFWRTQSAHHVADCFIHWVFSISRLIVARLTNLVVHCVCCWPIHQIHNHVLCSKELSIPCSTATEFSQLCSRFTLSLFVTSNQRRTLCSLWLINDLLKEACTLALIELRIAKRLLPRRYWQYCTQVSIDVIWGVDVRVIQQIEISELMWVAETGMVIQVLTCSTSHWVSGKSTYSVPSSLFPFWVKVFPRYCLSQFNYWAINCNTALIWSYVIPWTLSGGGIWFVLHWKVFGNKEITILRMIRYSLPMWAILQGNLHNHFHADSSGSIMPRPRICAIDTWRINCQRGPNGSFLPIFLACAEATPVIFSLCPLYLPSTKLMYNSPGPEDF